MQSILAVAFAMMAGLALSRAVKKVRLPNVTGYLIAGLLIGPCCFKLISADTLSDLSIISNVVLGFIAFSIGAEFKLSSIKAIGKGAIIITVFQALMATLFVDVALLALGFDTSVSLVLGAIATATAPAATLMVVRQYKAKGELTNTLLPVVAMDDAVGLMVFSISISIAKVFAFGTGADAYSMVVKPLIEIVLSLVVGGAIGFLVAFFMRFFHSNANKLCICIAAVFLGVALAKMWNLSDLLVCMAVGAVFVNLRNDSLQVLDLTDAWTPALFMLFFVISGADLDVTVLPKVGLLGVVYILARSLGKYFGAFLGSVVTKAPEKIRKYLGITLLPQAGVAIGMAQLALAQLPEHGAMIQAVVLAATLVYELFGPVATKIALKKAGEIEG